MKHYRVDAVCVASLLWLLAAPNASASVGGAYGTDGVDIGADEVKNIRDGRDPATGALLNDSYEYRTEVACSKQGKDANGDPLLCGNVAAQCDPTNPDIGPGPLTRVLRRRLDPGTGAPA